MTSSLGDLMGKEMGGMKGGGVMCFHSQNHQRHTVPEGASAKRDNTTVQSVTAVRWMQLEETIIIIIII